MSYSVVDLRGPRKAGGVSPLLAVPSAWAFALGARLHHGLYDAGMRRSRRAGVPTISVGAITVGGSGKTPVTRWLAAHLQARDRAPAILSRGYGSRGGTVPRVVDPEDPDAARDGDEPALLARALPGVPVVVCPDRVAGAEHARGLGARTLLLDDGMQHRRLHRDVNVCLWDRTAERSGGRLLPRGPLREPLSGVRRADLLVLVERAEGAPEPPAALAPGLPIFRARLATLARQELEPGRTLHALSGIADPESFERSLQALGFRLSGATRHPDHHAFQAAEILAAARRAATEGADHLAVTAKDHARWPKTPLTELPVPAVFDLEVQVDAEAEFLEAVADRLDRSRS